MMDAAAALAPPQMMLETLFNLLMLPAPHGGHMFMLNTPSWSLFHELLINILFALVLVRLRATSLIGVALVSGGMLVLGILHFGTANVGWDLATFPIGLARVTYGFTMGMLIFRTGDTIRRRRTTLSLLLPLVLTVALIMQPDRAYWAAYDAGAALLLGPILVWLGVRLEAPAMLGRICAFLGDISYPIYVIHAPLIFLGVIVLHRLGLSPVAATIVFTTAMIGIAGAAARFYDAPVRAWIGQWLRLRRSAPLQAI